MTWPFSLSRLVCGRMAAHLPGAQTERRGGAGPAGGLLGGKAPPAALLSGPWLVTPTDGSRDRDDFPAGPCRQAGEDANIHVGFQEMHGAVGEGRVRPAGVKAVDLSVVRAVDGTRPRLRGPVGARALAEGDGRPDPDAAQVVGPRD